MNKIKKSIAYLLIKLANKLYKTREDLHFCLIDNKTETGFKDIEKVKNEISTITKLFIEVETTDNQRMYKLSISRIKPNYKF